MSALAGRTALVTGGTSGIGLAIAARFVAEGAGVFVTGRRQPELDAAVARLGSAAIGVRSDVSDLADLDRLFARIAAHGKGLDVVVANAGGSAALETIETLTPEAFDSDFGINVRGTAFTVQKALPLLNDDASIITLGSTSASRATAALGTYSATKAAIRQLTRVWALELAPRGIRVNTLVPGPTETPGLKNALANGPGGVDAMLKYQAGRVALARVGHVDEIAAAALFLATGQSSFMTGSELFADGGEAQVLI
ncbi:SDR family NAD(P)-dependent oxidoreductase [Lentzea sp. NPDC051213]|uniref:SDR family NAD(P)-dependent oxidoreductase n=1 Tax=Lentzea sp. NPDC051213 TaxID=3364126 RepID=UPI00378FECB1